MDPMQVSSLGSFAEKFGFSALLVLVLLFGLWKLDQANRAERKERDTRDEEREKERRVERRETMDAHLGALGKHTEAVTQLGAGMVRLETKVDTLGRDVGVLKNRVKKFDPGDTDPGA
jgi:hypothetical protein